MGSLAKLLAKKRKHALDLLAQHRLAEVKTACQKLLKKIQLIQVLGICWEGLRVAWDRYWNYRINLTMRVKHIQPLIRGLSG